MRNCHQINRAPRCTVARVLAWAVGVALASLPGVASAATLASGVLASTGATGMICHVTNASTRPVEVTSARILSIGGVDITVGGNCGRLEPGRSCVIISQATDTGRGVAEVGGSAKKLRGSCQLLDSRSITLDAIEMR